MLPAEPTICVGQPTALDPSRAPEGAAILWLQLPEAPRFIKGDAAGEIAAPADGRWSEEIRERFADRVEALLAHHIEGFKDLVIARKAYSPADLERLNVNLVGGDPYGGYCGIDQFFLWRPLPGSVNHKTDVRAPLSYRRLDPSRARALAAVRGSCWRRRWDSGRCLKEPRGRASLACIMSATPPEDPRAAKVRCPPAIGKA